MHCSVHCRSPPLSTHAAPICAETDRRRCAMRRARKHRYRWGPVGRAPNAGSARRQASRIFRPEKTLVTLRAGRMLAPVMADVTTTIDVRQRRRERRQQVATVTASALAAHLGLTRQRIATLADVEHVIERLPDGRFDQNACRLRYLNWLRDPARRSARSAADADFVRAKTQLLELRVGERRGALIPRERVDATIDALAAIVTTHLASLGARCTQDLRIRGTIDAVVRQVRTEMAIAANKLADERGEPPLNANT